MKTSSISKNWKENIFLIACVCFFVLFVIIAAISGAWPGKDVSAQFFSAMAGALVAAIITLFLLKGQTAVEADRQKDSKVFEEKLQIYQDFLHKLCDVVKDMNIDEIEEKELVFQAAYITIHTRPESMLAVSKNIKGIVENIKKDDYFDERGMLEQLFDIADTFHLELYGEKYDLKNFREMTIDNFSTILKTKEDINQGENNEKMEEVKALEGKKLNLKDRAKLLKAMIKTNGSRQWICKDTLVHEYFTDVSEKTGKYIKSNRMIAIDLKPEGDNYKILLFTRSYDEEGTRKIAEGIGQTFKCYNENNGVRHLYKTIPMNTPNEEIALVMQELLAKIKVYRDKDYPLKK